MAIVPHRNLWGAMVNRLPRIVDDVNRSVARDKYDDVWFS